MTKHVCRPATPEPERPTVVDLYSGAGGLSLGMEQAGFDVVAAAEYDPIHALTHAYNFPQTPVVQRDLGNGAVSAVADQLRDASEGAGRGRTFDAVVGGPPCQGFSVGGLRDESDKRNAELLRFVTLVAELQPRVFCLENVTGLLEPRFGRLRERALGVLRRAGYEIGDYEVPVTASDFGVPQNRRRVLVFGALIGTPVPKIGAAINSNVTVRDALDGLPDDLSRYHRLLTSDCVEMNEHDYQLLIEASSQYALELSGLTARADDLSYRRPLDNRLLTNSLRTVHTSLVRQRFRRTSTGTVERISRLYRLSEDGVSRTLRAGTSSDRGSHTSPRPIHPRMSRVITVREAARIHGYPDWFRFHATNWHGHRQVGNSVPPPLAAAAGRALVESLDRFGLTRPSEIVQLGQSDWLTLKASDASKVLAGRTNEAEQSIDR